MQTVAFDISYEIPKGYRIAFEVYGENPLKISNGVVTKRSDITPILTGITNGEGKYNLSRAVSEQMKEIYVYSSFIGVPALLHGQISNGSVKPVALDLGEISPIAETAETRATSGYSYQTIGTWNYLGKPDYIAQREDISYTLLNAINQALPEWSAVSPGKYKQGDIHVKEKDLSLVKSLNNVEIRLVAMPDHPFTGKIYHVSEMLDENTRSVEVLVECDNTAHLMKPQMYGSVKLSDKETEVIRIPTSAIMQEEDNCYVLVSIGNHKYRRQKVTTGTTDNGKTLILSGLNQGEEIVSTGAFYLLDVR